MIPVVGLYPIVFGLYSGDAIRMRCGRCVNFTSNGMVAVSSGEVSMSELGTRGD